MKLTSFEAEDVHGYLNFNIKFFPEATFLIGINGSGKTTVLKLILGLTSPSYNYLSQIGFSRCRVFFYDDINGETIVIEAKQVKNLLFIAISTNNYDITSPPISIKGNKDSSRSGGKHDKDEFESSEVTKLIRNLGTPKFLGLDRRIHEGYTTDIDNYRYNYSREIFRLMEETRYSSDSKRNIDELMQLQSLDLSLSEVQSLITSYIRKIASRQIQIGEEYRQKIFQAVFKYSESNNTIGFHTQVENIEEIKQRRIVVNLAIQELGLPYLSESVNAFFDKMEDLLQTYVDSSGIVDSETGENRLSPEQIEVVIKWINNSDKLYQIDEIIKFSQQYQKQVNDLREPLKRLETIITNFLKEGSKALEVQDDGTLKVILKNSLSNSNLPKTSIKELSSGEKQIIIMIAHLIFEEDQKPSGIFIIDEPELSLHIAWQEIFVSSITEASPKTQFVLATHAPSIIAKSSMQQFCQDLSFSNI